MCEEKCFGITPLQNESNLNLWKFLNHKIEVQTNKQKKPQRILQKQYKARYLGKKTPTLSILVYKEKKWHELYGNEQEFFFFL